MRVFEYGRFSQHLNVDTLVNGRCMSKREIVPSIERVFGEVITGISASYSRT